MERRQSGPDPHGPVRVIICDDDPTLRLLVRVLLAEDPDLEVIGEASNGIEAVDLAGTLQPDVVVLNLGMPGMGGVEALPNIRAASPKTKVIVFSGFDPGEVPGLEAPDGYVQKGAPLEQLAREISVAGTARAA